MPTVRLREIMTAADRASVMGLRRGRGPFYVSSMQDSFAEADAEPRAMPHSWAVHDADGGELVGFVMISDNIPQPIDGDLVGPYFLWKLLVDAAVRRRNRDGAGPLISGCPRFPKRR